MIPNVKRVKLAAEIFSQSGYGIHSRQLARWLMGKHTAGQIELFLEPLNWGDTPWYIGADCLDGLVGRMQSLCVPCKDPDVTVQLRLPNEWNVREGKVRIGLTAGVETDKCNPEWVSACNMMTEVVVPSNHTLQTLSNSGTLTSPISVIPESYEEDLLSADGDHSRMSRFIDNLPPFNFLVFGQITGDANTDRKNTFKTLKILSETFKGDKDVGIVLKTNMGRGTLIDRANTRAVLNQWLSTFRAPKMPKIFLLHGDIPTSDLGYLYSHEKIKSLVTLTRGEGWGLPILEAAVCGLPVIATDWSGHLDFMNKGKFVKLQHTLREVHPSRVDGKLFVKGAKWAEVNDDDVKRKLSKFRDSSSMPRVWASELSTVLKCDYSRESVEKIYDSTLGKYL